MQINKKKNILILEDSPTQAVELEYILEKNGYEAVTCENGLKALEYLNDVKTTLPDIIISDIVMPGMNGFDFTRNLKESEKLKDIPVILLTSLSNPSDVILGLECGADNFITKPYKRDYLLSRIEYILINFQMRQHQASDLGVNIQFAGKKYYITSDRVQILDLLFSSFENAVQKNDELRDTIHKLNQTQKELVQAKELLNKLATLDSLTGLYNRRAFKQVAKKMIAMGNREKSLFAMFHLDIDNFKMINDTLGHAAGDEILKVTADKLTGALRENDLIGRIGGDEFAVLLTEVKGMDEINLIAEKILNLFREPVTFKKNKVYATMSIGISPSRGNASNTFKDLLKEADIAMYEAKKSGKSQYRVFNLNIEEHHSKRQSMEGELNRAVRENEFSMVYQPVIELTSNKIVAAESLIRWQNGLLGSVSPGGFIPFAEKSKQIHDIGYWVLNETMSQFAAWNKQKKNDLFLSINISPIQFERKNFIDVMMDTVRKYKLEPEKIILEITETAFSQSLTSETLVKLRDQNFLLAIDDFGSGYSSMKRLLDLPVSYMKIDGESIKRFTGNNKFKKVIENILSIAKSIKIDTIAECVETKEQADFLIKNGCRFAQGYYYHKPMKPAEFIKLIKS